MAAEQAEPDGQKRPAPAKGNNANEVVCEIPADLLRPKTIFQPELRLTGYVRLLYNPRAKENFFEFCDENKKCLVRHTFSPLPPNTQCFNIEGLTYSWKIQDTTVMKDVMSPHITLKAEGPYAWEAENFQAIFKLARRNMYTVERARELRDQNTLPVRGKSASKDSKTRESRGRDMPPISTSRQPPPQTQQQQRPTTHTPSQLAAASKASHLTTYKPEKEAEKDGLQPALPRNPQSPPVTSAEISTFTREERAQGTAAVTQSNVSWPGFEVKSHGVVGDMHAKTVAQGGGVTGTDFNVGIRSTNVSSSSSFRVVSDSKRRSPDSENAKNSFTIRSKPYFLVPTRAGEVSNPEAGRELWTNKSKVPHVIPKEKTAPSVTRTEPNPYFVSENHNAAPVDSRNSTYKPLTQYQTPFYLTENTNMSTNRPGTLQNKHGAASEITGWFYDKTGYAPGSETIKTENGGNTVIMQAYTHDGSVVAVGGMNAPVDWSSQAYTQQHQQGPVFHQPTAPTPPPDYLNDNPSAKIPLITFFDFSLGARMWVVSGAERETVRKALGHLAQMKICVAKQLNIKDTGVWTLREIEAYKGLREEYIDECEGFLNALNLLPMNGSYEQILAEAGKHGGVGMEKLLS